MTAAELINLEDGTKIIGNGRTMTVSKTIVPAMQDASGKWMPASGCLNVVDDATGQRLSLDLKDHAAKIEHIAPQFRIA